jgi:adenylosuccinate lyase
MTSSHLLDTTLALQLTRACGVLAQQFDRLVATTRDRGVVWIVGHPPLG